MATALPTDDELFDIIATEGQTPREGLSRDLRLADAGIASIEIISILFALEDRYGVALSEGDLAGCETMGDLIDRLTAGLKAAG
jgi:acyl carrier protein